MTNISPSCADAPEASAPVVRRPRAMVWALRASVPVLVGAMGLLVTPPASAVPSFADQTGQPCQACHVGGFGPELTPFGREFKLGGYTMRAKASVPIAAMAMASITHTRKGTDPANQPNGFGANDNLALDQVSGFLAGGIGNHFGGFAQVTYDGVNQVWHWDNMDLRAVTTGHVLGKDAVFGLTLNNSPTVSDVWNSTPAWGFPYYGPSSLVPTPGSAPLIDGSLAQEVIVASAYTWIDHQFYLEGGAYYTPAASTLSWLGADPAGGPGGSINGEAPYGRMAWQHDLAGGTGEIGVFALKADLLPGRDQTTGLTNHYTDIAAEGVGLRQYRLGQPALCS